MSITKVLRVVLTASLLDFVGIVGCDRADGSSKPEAWTPLTLANLGPITNMTYRAREISPDGKTLIQTRFWVQGKSVRLLISDASNVTAVASVSAVPDALWEQLEPVSEVIKTTGGTWARTWRLSELSPQQQDDVERLRHVLEEKYGKDKVTEEKTALGKWYPSSADSLKLYVLDINARGSGTPILKEGHLRRSMPDNAEKDRRVEIDFDPKTYLKRQERVFHGQKIVREAVWEINSLIDSSEFLVAHRDIANNAIPPKAFSGVGLLLNDGGSGGVKIIAVVTDSPAMKAGVKFGAALLSIDGQSTRGMPASKAVALLRGTKGTTVKVVVRNPEASSDQDFILTRDTIVSTGVFPVSEEEAGARGKQLMDEMYKE